MRRLLHRFAHWLGVNACEIKVREENEGLYPNPDLKTCFEGYQLVTGYRCLGCGEYRELRRVVHEMYD